MSIENMKRAASRLAKSREKGATTVALYTDSGFNLADMPIELFDALPALLAAVEASLALRNATQRVTGEGVYREWDIWHGALAALEATP